MLLPEFPTTELEDALRECGFTSFVTPDVGRGRRPRRAADHDPVADLADRRPDRRLVAVAVRRRADRAQPERRAAVRARRLQGARPGRRLPGAVLRRDLVPDGLRAAGAGEAGAGRDQARAAVRPHAALHRRARRAVRVPDRRAAVLPRRGAVGLQRHLRRRVEHLPRPDGLPRLAAPEGSRRGPAAAARARSPSSTSRTARSRTRTTRAHASFADKTGYLREMQARRMPEVEAAKATWAHPEIDILGRAAASGSPRCWRRPTTSPAASTAACGSPARTPSAATSTS